ncbi:glycosyltransferase family 4 protein [Flavobacterium sp.]|uniref:glycosyltransferase family 4 protein n=1 Tax=Flavobacterium sp. TaxID=239 RepID=UPI002FDB65FD
MTQTNKINFIDISVHNRNIKSIQEEIDFTQHSLGYLNFLQDNINPTIIRFGAVLETKDNYRLYRYSIQDLILMYRFFKSQEPTVALFHGFSFPFRFVFLKLLLGSNVQWIIQHHAGHPSRNPLKRWIQKMTYRLADRYMFVSKAQAQPFVEVGIIQSASLVAEIMECSTPFQLKDKVVCRNALGIPNDVLFFIWVGDLDANKDPMCMLKALSLYQKNGNDFQLHLFYVETELLASMKQFVTEQQLEEHVVFHGKIANPLLENWFNAADVYLSCSHSEGSGIALAEAMACGCFPIVSNIPSFVQMTVNGKSGLLFEKGNSESLYEKLKQLDTLDLANERWKTNQTFQKELSFEAIGIKTSELIQSLYSR